jgi:hypothetical protein
VTLFTTFYIIKILSRERIVGYLGFEGISFFYLFIDISPDLFRYTLVWIGSLISCKYSILFILCIIFFTSLKIPAAHVSGDTIAHQEHAIYTELSKREPGTVADFLLFLIF